MTDHITKTDIRHLKSLKPILTKPLIYSFILSNDKAVTRFEENIIALPAAMFLSW